MAVKARPRTAWEGIDLGFVMARQWFLPLWTLWLMTGLPLGMLLYLLAGERLWLAMLLAWWFKPLYEPPLLFWLSRTVFGEQLRVAEVARHWFHIVRPQLLANLTWRRFNPSRSFHMPVALLEGLRGKQRAARISVLGRGQQAGAWLTVTGIHFEAVLEISALVLVVILLPEELRWLDLKELFFTPGRLGEGIQYLTDLIAMSLIAPFYVAGGFALYLNRRSELEAWDIEISLRRLMARRKAGRRLSGAVAALLAILCFSILLPGPALQAAETEQEKAGRIIQEVLADDDFGKREERTYWKYVGEKKSIKLDPEWLETLMEIIAGFFKGLANVGEILLWLGGGMLAAYLIYRIYTNRGWLQLQLPGRKRRSRAPVELFGLEVAPETLPDDIAEEAQRLLAAGKLRAALSLLYRGVLVKLVHEYQLEVPASATEGECLQLVATNRAQAETSFFQRLTQTWLRMAYGHMAPEKGQVETLCQDWRRVYADEE